MNSRIARSLAVLAFALTTTALANGRFPLAQQLIVDPKAPDRLVLRATYGLLVSDDHGQSWSWICEQSIGYGGVEDPSVGTTLSGALVVGIFDGFRRSADGGCNFSFPDSKLEGRYAVDLTVSPVDRKRVLVLTSNGVGGGQFDTRVWESLDEGLTFAQLGSELPSDLLGLTLDPAPSDADRIYVSGIGPAGVGVFYTSTDRGQSWTPHAVPGADIQSSPFIGAVHPTEPSIVYVRTAGSGQNRLLVTQDSGASFSEVFAAQGRMLGFALSPDGGSVLLGYGDPKGGTPIDPATLGLYLASTSDHQFARIHDGPINCLTWTTAGLYACGSQFVQGFELGFTPAALSSSSAPAFETLLKLTTVGGPLACEASSTTAPCVGLWPALCDTLGACEPADGGTGGPAPATDDPGCDCRAPRREGGPAAWLLAALVGTALILRRNASRR